MLKNNKDSTLDFNAFANLIKILSIQELKTKLNYSRAELSLLESSELLETPESFLNSVIFRWPGYNSSFFLAALCSLIFFSFLPFLEGGLNQSAKISRSSDLESSETMYFLDFLTVSNLLHLLSR